jgi:hypothetical protein
LINIHRQAGPQNNPGIESSDSFELTVGIYLDPTLITNQKEVLMDVDVSHGPGYGSARIYADSVAPRLGERKVNIVLDVDAKRFVKTFVKAMQWEPPK